MPSCARYGVNSHSRASSIWLKNWFRKTSKRPGECMRHGSEISISATKVTRAASSDVPICAADKPFPARHYGHVVDVGLPVEIVAVAPKPWGRFWWVMSLSPWATANRGSDHDTGWIVARNRAGRERRLFWVPPMELNEKRDRVEQELRE